MIKNTLHSKQVRKQYEAYPLPHRLPEDEYKRLVVSPVDIIPKINHYCFQGKESFQNEFRVLVAGGGTGDSVIFLAHQLRNTNAEIVYLDFSKASMEVAKERAKIRKLENITWVCASITDIPELGIGKFNYITCLGVIHHLDVPELGLKCLSDVLLDDGAMALMLYGKYGRIHTYLMQDLIKDITADINDMEQKLNFARQILINLPPTNLFRARQGINNIRDTYLNDSSHLYDDLIHAKDKSYSVTDIYELLETCDLNLIEFTTYLGPLATNRRQYDIRTYIKDRELLNEILKYENKKQMEFAEIIDGSISLHTFYVGHKKLKRASFLDGDLIPFFMTNHAQEASNHLIKENKIDVILRNAQRCSVSLDNITCQFLSAIDGEKTINDILKETNSVKFHNQIVKGLEILNSFNWVLLRSQETTPFLPFKMSTIFKNPCTYEEPVSIANDQEN